MSIASVFKSTLVAGVSALALTVTVAAADTGKRYDVPAQPLAQALAALSAQADASVFAPNDLLAGKSSRALSGTYTLDEALGIILEGTGLEAEAQDKGTIVVRRRVDVPQASAVRARAGRAGMQDDDAGEIEELVVVGQTTNVDITAADLEKLQANDLADIFRATPSVSVGGSLGIAQKIYIRGVEDTLLNITVDGAPQTGTLFHHIGRVSIEPELLRQVEVQAGAGEATSGFGAIGGAIRFRTKDANDLLDADRNFGGLAKASYFSNDGYKLSLSAYGRLSDNWDILGSYVWVDRGNMEDGAGDEIHGTAAEQALAFFKLSGRLGEGQKLSLSYEQRNEEGEFGQRPNWVTLESDTLFPVDAKRQTAVANYMLERSELLNLEVSAYYTRSRFIQDRFDRWGQYGATMETFGFDLRNTSRFGAHELIYGVEHRNDTVDSEYLADRSVWENWAWDPAVGSFEEKGKVYGIYLQDHFQIADPLTLSLGVRYDAYELDQTTYGDSTDSDDLSFNAGFLYAITPELSFTAGYAEASRGKEVGDAFTLERQPGRLSVAPDLQAENVTNKELGLVYDDGAFLASASYYRTKIKDVILDQLGSGPAPQDSIYYENVGTFDADGFEFRVSYTAEKWRADAFYTTYDSTLNDNPVDGYEHIGLANASGDNFVFSVAYMPVAQLEIGYRLTHVQDLNDIEVLHRALEIGWIDALQQVDKPGYTVHDIYVQWLPTGSENLRVNLAVDNLFDKRYRDHASVADYNNIPGWEGVAGLYEAGRDIRLSVSLGF